MNPAESLLDGEKEEGEKGGGLLRGLFQLFVLFFQVYLIFEVIHACGKSPFRIKVVKSQNAQSKPHRNTYQKQHMHR
jgi:hypothetical protein